MKPRFGIALLLLALVSRSGYPADGSGASTAPQPAATATAPTTSAAVPATPAKALAPPTSLAAAATRLRARLSWDPLTDSGWFERSGDRLSFAVGVPRALWNFRELLAIDPPAEAATGPLLTETSLTAIEGRFKTAEAARGNGFSVAAILIDPGHGGKDSGAVGEHVIDGKKIRVVEKDISLDVARRVWEALRARYPDKRILLSREGDSYPTLEQRVEMANSVDLGEREAIIYVSVHANASFNKNAKGYEVWYLNPDYRRTVIDSDRANGKDRSIAPILNAMLEEEFTTESIILARDIVARLGEGIGDRSPDRGVRAEEWFVVRNARMPSVLVEMGFVTNPEEARLLSSSDYLKKVADGIYSGLVDFVGDFESQKAEAGR